MQEPYFDNLARRGASLILLIISLTAFFGGMMGHVHHFNTAAVSGIIYLSINGKRIFKR